MRVVYIEGTSIDDVWFQCLGGIWDSGRTYVVDHGSYAGIRRLEYEYIVLKVSTPWVRPLEVQIPAGMNIPSPCSKEYVDEYLVYLMSDSKKDGEEYTYGMYLEKQIEGVIKKYKKYGYNSNQCYMTVGDINTFGMEHPPCLRGIDTKVIDNRLHFIVYFRSWDLWAGFPTNVAGLQLMKEYMASEIGVGDGEIIASSKGLHLYEYVWEFAKQRIGLPT